MPSQLFPQLALSCLWLKLGSTLSGEAAKLNLHSLAAQVLLFTATMPAEVEATAERWQRHPVRLHVMADGAQISRTVTQVRACFASFISAFMPKWVHVFLHGSVLRGVQLEHG